METTDVKEQKHFAYVYDAYMNKRRGDYVEFAEFVYRTASDARRAIRKSFSNPKNVDVWKVLLPRPYEQCVEVEQDNDLDFGKEFICTIYAKYLKKVKFVPKKISQMLDVDNTENKFYAYIIIGKFRACALTPNERIEPGYLVYKSYTEAKEENWTRTIGSKIIQILLPRPFEQCVVDGPKFRLDTVMAQYVGEAL